MRTNGQELEWNSLYIDQAGSGLVRAVFAGDNPTVGAVLHQVSLVDRGSGDLSLDQEQRVDAFYGQSANAVTRVGDAYFLSAGGGQRGGLFSYNINENAQGNRFIQTYMKSAAAADDNTIVALKGGTDAALYVFELTNGFTGEPSKTISLAPITPILGKNSVWMEGNKAFLALGQTGFAVIDDVTTDNEATYITGTREESCNSVTTDANFIYLAYDQYVEFLDKNTYESYGTLSFDRNRNERASINHVISFNYNGQYALAVADKEFVRILSLQ